LGVIAAVADIAAAVLTMAPLNGVAKSTYVGGTQSVAISLMKKIGQ
jgi:acyl-coenzyme A thioesterase PaaI-like protein